MRTLHARRADAVLGGQLADELLDERADVGVSIAERRHGQGDPLNAVVEVGPEAARLDLLVQRAKRGADEACVDADLRVASDPHEPAILQEAQQLGLHGQRHLADLVEEERPAGRRLDLALRSLARAGEGAPLVPEQLALEEGLGDGRAVDRNERTRPPAGKLVDASCEDLFARAALADEGDGDVLASRRSARIRSS